MPGRSSTRKGWPGAERAQRADHHRAPRLVVDEACRDLAPRLLAEADPVLEALLVHVAVELDDDARGRS